MQEATAQLWAMGYTFRCPCSMEALCSQSGLGQPLTSTRVCCTLHCAARVRRACSCTCCCRWTQGDPALKNCGVTGRVHLAAVPHVATCSSRYA